MKTYFHQALFVMLFSALLTLAFGACAALTVAGDLGGESTSDYFDAINAEPNNGDGGVRLSPPASAGISDMLPVSTPEMSPGAVDARALTLPGMPPVFVLGDDAVSRQWLLRQAAALRQLQATGLVVSVRDEPGLAALRQIAPDIVMVPVRGGDLSRRLGLTHYPALITATGITQ